MPEGTLDGIGRIACEVLGKQAFLLADPMDAAGFEAADEPWYRVTIAFAGASRGSLVLVAGESLAREIAAGVLGTDPGDPAAASGGRDALKEILNVICGHVLTSLHGVDALHDLSIPDLLEITGPEAAGMARRPGCLALAVEDRQALILADLPPLPEAP